MAEVHEIDVQIDAGGNVSVEVRGVSGKKCEELTALLEQALGGGVVERVHKPEYHEQAADAVESASVSSRG